MSKPKMSKLEFQVMELLWGKRQASIRELHEALGKSAAAKRPYAYTTIQTVMYRLEEKGFVKRIGKVENFHLFAPVITRDKAQRRILDELLGFFGGKGSFVMSHLIEAGELTLEDVKDAEDLLRSSGKRRKPR